MEALLTKLISLLDNFYLASYIIAGAAVGIGLTLIDIPFFHTEFWINLGLCYFAGMIASRLGSLVIEPVCKMCKIISWEPYAKFLEAERKDTTAKLLSLSKVNGTYCTMTAVSLILFIVSIVNNILALSDWTQYLKFPLVYLLVFILFLLSYRKQVGYTVKRINYLLDSQTAQTADQ